jgi:hypothetical protein
MEIAWERFVPLDDEMEPTNLPGLLRSKRRGFYYLHTPAGMVRVTGKITQDRISAMRRELGIIDHRKIDSDRR